MTEPMILAADVGGTNTRLALFQESRGALMPAALEIYPSREFPSLGAAIEKFLLSRGAKVAAVCAGVAGPVEGGRVEATNLPWIVDAQEVSKALAGIPVKLLNDLEANAWGVGELAEPDFVVLNAGSPRASGNQAIIAAGTGLGQALMIADDARPRPIPAEAGHTDFAPRTDEEAELLKFLRRDFGRVSWERVVSGPGLFNIYRFLRDAKKMPEPEWLARDLKGEDPSAAISKAAMEGRAEICSRALDIFVSAYGAQSGNWALSTLARGGLFIGGGIAPKIIAKLKEPPFMAAFLSKGRLRPLLEAMPVRVILNDQAALLGAARCARLLCAA